MIQLTIDGQTVEAPAGATVLQACRTAGIEIPTLCDHPALKPYGGCRLCVVEVEGARSLMTSCTLPIYNGMVVRTNTPKVRKAREFILTLLFSERNHFCMFCQKSGGDCDLQNSAYGEGMTHWPLQPNWKDFPLDATGPYFIVDNNRCILCRRCVRACGDLVGNFTLGIENRGASSMLVADYGVPQGESSCIRCGTCVQVCPTGALIDKQSAYLGLDKSAQQIESVCIGCSIGCGINLIVHDNHLVRIDGLWGAPVNDGVLCELGRFQSLKDERSRLQTPLVRKNGLLEPATWEEALDVLAAKLTALRSQNGHGIAAMASTRLPAEALYTFKDLFSNKLGSTMVSSIEEKLTAADAPDAESFGLEALKEADCVVVIGADLVKSHQVAGFFVKRNLPKGTNLIVIDPFENQMDDLANVVLRPKASADTQVLQCLMQSLAKLGLADGLQPAGYDAKQPALDDSCQATNVPAEAIVEASRLIGTAHKPVFVFGKGLTQKASSQALDALKALAEMAGGATLINLMGKANSLAAQRYGLDKAFTPEGYQAVFLALGDDYPTNRLVEYLAGVPFLAVQASYVSALTDRADVVLPVEIWTEQNGHYLNLEGRLQAAHKASVAPAGIWSNFTVLKTLAKYIGVDTSDLWEENLFQRSPEFVPVKE